MVALALDQVSIVLEGVKLKDWAALIIDDPVVRVHPVRLNTAVEDWWQFYSQAKASMRLRWAYGLTVGLARAWYPKGMRPMWSGPRLTYNLDPYMKQE